MTEENKQNNIISVSPEKEDIGVGEELRKRIGAKLPEGVDISSIGNIDLYEAEKIATEEIIFLTENDLIEGLEDFELIPLKNDTPHEKSSEKNDEGTPGLRIKTISSEDAPEEKMSEFSADNEGDISEFTKKISGVEIPEKAGKESPDEFTGIIPDTSDSDIERVLKTEVTPEKIETSDQDVEPDSEIVLPEGDTPRPEHDVEDFLPEGKEGYSGTVPERITEISINHQFEEIFSEIEMNEEIIPGRFSSDGLTSDVKFIDDLKVNRSRRSLPVYNEDPLTERLARIIQVSDAPMSVITAKSDFYDDHAYLLEDTTLYEKSGAAASESDEIFFSDPDLDFFEHAIVKNDFSRFIQEIDDYYDITKTDSESRVSEILGLNSEEREIINDELFSGYYSNIDFDSEIDFLNPNLDYINRSYVESKDVSYLLENPDSLIDEEKFSIEDDITAPSAIVFEEDVEDLKLLMERDYGLTARERIESDISAGSGFSHGDNVMEPESEQDEISIAEDSPVIINITDQVIILEDKENVDAFTSRFPDKKEDLAKLFSYLDGLFEKLPEETVKKFAQSEYFDLYVKVMNEIGA